jgi:hypothetical protein
MQYILPLALWALAAILNAIMDRLENLPAFNKSIFSHQDEKFWCKEVSWQYATKIFSWKVDAWHIAKSSMIILMALTAITFQSTGNVVIDLLLLGASWNLPFTVFYNKVLKR